MAKVLYGWSKDDIHQGLLEQVVRTLFAGEDVSKNVRKDASIRSPVTGNFLEIDVWVPNQNISFEFQDPYHYITTWDNQVPLSVIKENDSAKKEASLRRGETLIAVPCWWDGKDASLVGTILFERPDLLPQWHRLNIKPIPLNPPRFFFGGGKIPDVGELMLASFPLSVQFGSSISFESFWWMGEKYDGVRFCWNPKRNTLFSRAGLVLSLEESFYPHFPKKTFLDGEIWFGRGTFQESQRLITTEDEEPIEWENLRLMSFDDPTQDTADLPFEKRYAKFLSFIAKDSPSLAVATRVKCVAKRQLVLMAQSITSGGGEGIVLRKPKSVYEYGRSAFLLKIKATRGDKEALVVTVGPTDTELQLPDGTIFSLPSLPKSNIKRGDVVTFGYTAFSRNSLPTHSKILRIRLDVEWGEVVREWEEQSAQELYYNEASRNLVDEKKSSKPRDVWISDKEKTMRELLEAYAKSKSLDPLIPENWYTFKHQHMLKVEKGKAILQHYDGNYVDALLGLFPEIGLDKTKFETLPRNYWGELENRREFFREFAKHENFDYLIPENWYTMNVTRFQSFKGGYAVLKHYDGDWTKALIHVFPDIGLDKEKLIYVPRTFWQVSERRDLFVDFAKYKGFDPTNLNNWYMIRMEELYPYKDIKYVIDQHYEGKLRSALQHLFPSFGKLPKSSAAYWKDEENQRAVFEAIAEDKGFDPLIAKNWYSLKYDTVISFKGGVNTLRYYNGSYGAALMKLFPNIGLDLSKFEQIPKKEWMEFNNQKKFFVNFAASKKFDPLVANNWRNVTRQDITSLKGGTSLLRIYDHSLPKALQHVFPEVSFTKANFSTPKFDEYLTSAAKRRIFFENFAKSKNFNPLNASAWYNVSLSSIIASKKEARVIMGYYDGNLSKALRILFPEVSFDRSRFVRISRKHYWSDIENQKRMFRSFATSKGFQANRPENWYTVKISDITDRRGGKAVLRHYGGSLPKALLRVFPNIGLFESYFTSSQKGKEDPKNRRAVFEKFAGYHKFDPLNAENWYKFSRSEVGNMKGGKEALEFYGGNLANTLAAVFPDITFNEKLFLDP